MRSGAQGWETCPQDPQTRSPLSLKFPNVSRVLPLDPTPALTLANLSLTVSPF